MFSLDNKIKKLEVLWVEVSSSDTRFWNYKGAWVYNRYNLSHIDVIYRTFSFQPLNKHTRKTL